MTYAIDRKVLASGKQIFPYSVGGEKVFVKQGRPVKNPLGRLAQVFLYRLTDNLLLIPPAAPVAHSVAHESAKLRRLAELGVRVPAVLHAETNYFVMSDVGETLHKYLKRRPEFAGEYLEATAWELRKLHDLGFAHGASQIKNMTLRDGAIYFIDFEEDVPERYLEKFKLRDIFLLLHSFERHGHDPDLPRFFRNYAGDAWHGCFTSLRDALRGVRAVRLARPLLRRWRMRDIRSLNSLVDKAAAPAAGVDI